MGDLVIENKLITLNSVYAQKLNGTYNSSVLFNFKGILVEEDDIVSSNICVMNAQIPVSFYIIAEDFDILYYDSSFNLIGNTTIFAGNYNFNAIKKIIDADTVTLGILLTFNIDRSTGKVFFEQTAPTNLSFIVFEATTVAIGLKYAKIFGYNTRTIAPVANKWIAPNPINLLGVKKISIQSQKLQISAFSSVSTNLGIVLTTIPVDQPAFNMISYTNQTDLNKALLQTKYIDSIDISLTDEDNNLLNFNNIDWTITLVLENIRRLSDVLIPKFKQLLEAGITPTPLIKEKAEKPITELDILNSGF